MIEYPIIDAEWEPIDETVVNLTEDQIVKPPSKLKLELISWSPVILMAVWTISRNILRIISNYNYYKTTDELSFLRILIG